VSGSGTTNTIPVWTSSSTIGNSSVTDNATTFAINTNKFTVTEASGNTAVAGTLNVTGSSTLAAAAATELDGTGTTTATATSGTVNDWDPTGGGNVNGQFIIREAPTAALTPTGLVAGNAGQILVIRNTSTTAANTITINNENASSTAGNRFTLSNAASAVIAAGASCTLRYSDTASRWEPIGDCASTMTTLPNRTLTITDTGTQNDYNPTGLASTSVLLANNGSTLTITGLQGGQDGRIVYVCAENANVQFNNEAAGSTAANRLAFPGPPHPLQSARLPGLDQRHPLGRRHKQVRVHHAHVPDGGVALDAARSRELDVDRADAHAVRLGLDVQRPNDLARHDHAVDA